MSKTLAITKRQQKDLIKRFGHYGTKQDLVKQKGVARATLTRLIRDGRADERTIRKLSEYLGYPLETSGTGM